MSNRTPTQSPTKSSITSPQSRERDRDRERDRERERGRDVRGKSKNMESNRNREEERDSDRALGAKTYSKWTDSRQQTGSDDIGRVYSKITSSSGINELYRNSTAPEQHSPLFDKLCAERNRGNTAGKSEDFKSLFDVFSEDNQMDLELDSIHHTEESKMFLDFTDPRSHTSQQYQINGSRGNAGIKSRSNRDQNSNNLSKLDGTQDQRRTPGLTPAHAPGFTPVQRTRGQPILSHEGRSALLEIVVNRTVKRYEQKALAL